MASREVKKDSYLNQKLADKVPAKLQGQLDKAFAKAFGMVFEKGTGVIEKTYKKEELQKTFKINEYANEVRQTRKSLKTFGRRAENSGRINMLVSGVAGVGMGVVGVGIPDIPVFTGMILKSIYEIALNYGYEYDTEGERRFILLLIQGAVSYGQEMLAVNELVDLYIQTAEIPDCYDEKEQIEKRLDAVQELCKDGVSRDEIREYLIKVGFVKVNDLQVESLKYVSAKSQSIHLGRLMESNFLTSDEIDVFKCDIG